MENQNNIARIPVLIGQSNTNAIATGASGQALLLSLNNNLGADVVITKIRIKYNGTKTGLRLNPVTIKDARANQPLMLGDFPVGLIANPDNAVSDVPDFVLPAPLVLPQSGGRLDFLMQAITTAVAANDFLIGLIGYRIAGK